MCSNSSLSATSTIVTANLLSFGTITTVATPATYYIGSTITLSLTGLVVGPTYSYQWQNNINGAGFNNIAGATSATYATPTVTAVPTSYQCIITACTGTLTTTSSVFVVTPTAGYCVPATTSQASWISAFSTTGGVINITHTAASGATGGYINLTASSVSNYLGQTTNFSVTAGGPTVGFAIWVDWNNNNEFETTERVYVTTGYITTGTGTIAIPALTANGNYRMRVFTDFNNSAPSNPCATNILRGEYKDFTFSVVDAPSCIAPTSPVNSSVTAATASHAWTAASPVPAVGYQWAVTTSATPPASGTATAGLTASSTGLTANTIYYLHVRSDCGAGLFSPWATSASFFTGYCSSVSTSATSFINNFVTTGGTTNISNTATGYSAGGYGDFTSQIVTQQQGAVVNVSGALYALSDDGMAIWVDWNDNLAFEATERVYNSAAYLATFPPISFTVPATAAIGNHRMRIVLDYNATSPAACGTISRGETEDYTIKVTAGTPCSGAPVGVAITPTSSIVCGTGGAIFTASTTSTGLGITFAWESSPAGLNTWTPIGGATTNTYIATAVTVSTDYHCILTCSGNSTTSPTASITIGAAPINDEACGAIVLALDGAIDCGNTTCATSISDPTLPGSCSTPNNTVWYSYTPTVTQAVNVRVTTPATGNLFGWLNWFTATGTCPTLTFTAVNAACQPFGQTANDSDTLASPILTAGTTYYLMIDGNSGSFGAYCINLLTPPIPPNCTTNITPSNGATGIVPPATLSWNAAPTASTYTIFFSSVNNPPLPTDSATTVAGTSVTLTGALPSTTYYWYVTPKNAGGVAIGCSSSVTSFTTAAAPANDLCANATVIPCDGSVSGNNALASNDVLDPLSCGSTSFGLTKGVWFSVTPTTSGPLTVSTCTGTAWDTYLRVYTGSCGTFTTCAGFDDDGCAESTFGLSSLTFTATAGTTYYVLLSGYNAADFGAYTISVTCPPVCTGVSTWTGNISTDWNNVGNWICGIPTITSEVVIPADRPNYPVINTNVEIKKITLDPSTSVTVATGFELKLNGN
jgi:hypothetical protein